MTAGKVLVVAELHLPHRLASPSPAEPDTMGFIMTGQPSQGLSMRRAQSVMAYLPEHGQHTLDPYVDAGAMDEARPVSSNSTPAEPKIQPSVNANARGQAALQQGQPCEQRDNEQPTVQEF